MSSVPIKRPRDVVDVDAVVAAGGTTTSDAGADGGSVAPMHPFEAIITRVYEVTQPVAEIYKIRQHLQSYPQQQQQQPPAVGALLSQLHDPSIPADASKRRNYNTLVCAYKHRQTLLSVLRPTRPLSSSGNEARKEEEVGKDSQDVGEGDKPLIVDTVILLADNGRILVCENGARIRVGPHMAKSILPGDVILCRHDRVQVTTASETTDASEAVDTSVVRLLGLNFAALREDDERHNAAEDNVQYVTEWLLNVLQSAAPGLGQLTELAVACESTGADEDRNGVMTRPLNIWTRSLLLPLVLGDELRTGLGSGAPLIPAERRTMHFLASAVSGHFVDSEAAALQSGTRSSATSARLPPPSVPNSWVPSAEAAPTRQGILFAFEMYAMIITQADTMIPIPSLSRQLALQFFASPLFVEGLTTIAAQTFTFQSAARASGHTSYSIHSAEAFKKLALDILLMAIQEVCIGDELGVDRDVSFFPDSTLTDLRQDATAGVFTVIHRLTQIWVARRSAESSSFLAVSPAAHLMCAIVEELAENGMVQRVAQWFRRQRSSGALITTTMNAASPQSIRRPLQLSRLDALKAPPSLETILAEYSLERDAISEAVEAVRRMYTPILTGKGPRVAEAAMRAVYTEVFGPVAHLFALELGTSSTTNPSSALHESTEKTQSYAKYYHDQWLLHQHIVHTLPLDTLRSRCGHGRNALHLFLPCKFRITSLAQRSIPSRLSELVYDEVLYASKFGFPVALNGHVALDDKKERSGRRARDVDTASAAAAALDRLQRPSVLATLVRESHALAWESRAAFLLVRLAHENFSFPCVLRGVPKLPSQEGLGGGASTPTLAFEAYVLSNRDVLPQVLAASAQLSPDELPEAWLYVAPLSLSVARTLSSNVRQNLPPPEATVADDADPLPTVIQDELEWARTYTASTSVVNPPSDEQHSEKKSKKSKASNGDAGNEDGSSSAATGKNAVEKENGSGVGNSTTPLGDALANGEADRAEQRHEYFSQNSILPPGITVLAAMEVIELLSLVRQRLVLVQDIQNQTASSASSPTALKGSKPPQSTTSPEAATKKALLEQQTTGNTLWAEFIASGGEGDLITSLTTGSSHHLRTAKVSNNTAAWNGVTGTPARSEAVKGDRSVFQSISSSVSNADREAYRKALTQYVEAAGLTAPQIECLYTLSTGDAGVRVAEGPGGSGKTTIVRATAKVIGSYHNLSRQAHAREYQPLLRQSLSAIQDLVRPWASQDTSSALNDGNEAYSIASNGAASDCGRTRADVRRMLSELRYVTPTVLERTEGFARLLSACRQRAPPLYVHARACTSQGAAGKDGMEPSVGIENIASVTTLDELVRETYQRSLRAPLTQAVAARLEKLHSLLEQLDATLEIMDTYKKDAAVQEEAGESRPWPIFIPLLPFVFSSSEIDNIAQAAEAGNKTWAEKVKEMWGTDNMFDTLPHQQHDGKGAAEDTMRPWAVMVESFSATALPSAAVRGITAYDATELLAWRTVFGEAQENLVLVMKQNIIKYAQHLFRVLNDVVYGVAITSQVQRVAYVAATESDLLRYIPFITLWRPSYVLVDDFDCMRDVALLCTPAPHSLVLAKPSETTPNYQWTLPLAALEQIKRITALTRNAASVFSLTTLSELHRFLNRDQAKLARLMQHMTFAPPSTGEAALLPAPGEMSRNDAHADDMDGGRDGSSSTYSLRGFGKGCNVHMWTHLTPDTRDLHSDGVAAEFVLRRLLRYEPTIRVRVYAFSLNDAVEMLADVPASAIDSAAPDGSSQLLLQDVLRYAPLYMNGERVDDDECDVVVLCLSGVLSSMHWQQEQKQILDDQRRQRALSGNNQSLLRRQYHVGRGTGDDLSEWQERLIVWMRRCVAAARRGFIAVASKEAAALVDPLEKILRLTLQMRQQLPADVNWLPSEVGCEVLALSCPDHEHNRQIAWVSDSAYDGRVAVKHTGIECCGSLCLKPYAGCTNRSHGCLLSCHCHLSRVMNPLLDDGERDSEMARLQTQVEQLPLHSGSITLEQLLCHESCPFVCGKQLPCSHFCVKRCGEPCGTCGVEELRELPCGQHVISGISDSSTVQYRCFPHFQMAQCGTDARPCVERVRSVCSRCGEKNFLACWLTQRMRKEQSQNQSASDAEQEPHRLVLKETVCRGCVGIYNRVAKEVGAPLVQLDIIDECEKEANLGSDPQRMDDIVARALSVGKSLPREQLSQEGNAKLDKLFSIASRKCELLEKKEALDITKGNQVDTDFARAQREYENQKQRRDELKVAHRQYVKQETLKWSSLMRSKFEAQMELNTVLESVVKRLSEDAISEAERQRMSSD